MDVIQGHCLLLKRRPNVTPHLRHAWHGQGERLLLAERELAARGSTATEPTSPPATAAFIPPGCPQQPQPPASHSCRAPAACKREDDGTAAGWKQLGAQHHCSGETEAGVAKSPTSPGAPAVPLKLLGPQVCPAARSLSAKRELCRAHRSHKQPHSASISPTEPVAPGGPAAELPSAKG